MGAGDVVYGDKYELAGSYPGATLYVNSTIGVSGGEPPAVRPAIFLSYSWNDDKPFAERLQASLMDVGFTVWRDETHLPSRGDALDAELKRAIDDSVRFVPVVGPGAFASRGVQLEWSHARQTCKAITPLWRLGGEMPDDFRKLLYFDFRESEPGYDYDNALRKLIDRLRAPEILPGSVYGSYPLPPAGAIPRREMSALEHLLRPEATAVTITGRAAVGALHAPGGLGKTVLAAMFLRDCATRRAFSDGLVWLIVGKNPDVAVLQGEVGHWLGDDPKKYRDATTGKACLQALLARRRALIVLDDVWDASHVEAFMVDAPNCRWLVTTRQPGLGGRLKLSAGNVLSLDYLTDDEGAALIIGRLGDHVSEEDRPLYRDIAAELRGHTLAIDIAASRLAPNSEHYVGPGDLLRRLRARRDGPDPFADLKLDAADRERNLELSLAESYEMLGEDERRRFRMLGAFAPEGTFSGAMAAAVWGDESDTATDALSRLAGMALLSRAEGERYRQHAILRAYALALLKRAGEDGEARARHFVAYATEYGDHGRNTPYAAEGRHDQITADFANVDHAFEWGLTGAPQAACDLLNALENSYMQFRLSPESRLAYLEKTRKAARSVGYQRGEANTLQAIGDVQNFRDDRDAALESYGAALALFRAVGDRLGEANTLKAMGFFQIDGGNGEEGLKALDDALALYRAVADRVGQANIFWGLGARLWQNGQPADAEPLIAEAVRLGNEIARANPIIVGWENALAQLRQSQ